jgi:hypothetical protein
LGLHSGEVLWFNLDIIGLIIIFSFLRDFLNFLFFNQTQNQTDMEYKTNKALRAATSQLINKFSFKTIAHALLAYSQ